MIDALTLVTVETDISDGGPQTECLKVAAGMPCLDAVRHAKYHLERALDDLQRLSDEHGELYPVIASVATGKALIRSVEFSMEEAERRALMLRSAQEADRG